MNTNYDTTSGDKSPDQPLNTPPPPPPLEPSGVPQPAQPQLPDFSAPTPPQKPSMLREFISTMLVLLVALGIALSLIMFVFQSYAVDGQSMERTLYNKDRLIVWKLPRTIARITGNEYVPKRGDIIVFTENSSSMYPEGSSEDKQLIKRVIGLPGDRVVQTNGIFTVYNEERPGGFQPDNALLYGDLIEPSSGNLDITLGANELFVVGDNRNNSLDSRSFGPIELEQVVGKLVLKVLPFDEAQRF